MVGPKLYMLRMTRLYPFYYISTFTGMVINYLVIHTIVTMTQCTAQCHSVCLLLEGLNFDSKSIKNSIDVENEMVRLKSNVLQQVPEVLSDMN